MDVDVDEAVAVVPPRRVDVLPAGLVRGVYEEDEDDTREFEVEVDATVVGLGVATAVDWVLLETDVVLTTMDEVFDDEEEEEEEEEDLAVDESGAAQALSKYVSGPSGSASKLPLKGMLNSMHSLPPYPKLWQLVSLAQRVEQAAYVEYLPLPL